MNKAHFQRLREALWLVLCFVAATAGVASALADDWPQWLGPNRDSIWREDHVLDRFPESGLKILWRSPISSGYSGPIVAGDRVYVTDRLKAGAAAPEANPFSRADSPGLERVLCFDEKDGRLLWKHQYPCEYTVSYAAGPRVAPLIHQGKVYTLGAEGDLLCLDASNGKVLWQHNFKRDLGAKTPMWGFTGHPLIEGNRLICIAAGQGSTVVAYDKDSGAELWRALSASEPGYSSPVVYDVGGRRQLIIFHAQAANSLNPENGELYWSVPFKSNMGLGVATPRLLGQSLFFTSFYNGALMLKLDPLRPEATTAWKTEKESESNTTHLNAIIPTPFLDAGYIYGICSYGQLRCLRMETGERVWESLKAATDGKPVRWGNAFLVKNGDRVFLFNEKGDLIIAKLTPAGYDEVSRAHLIDPLNGDPGRKVVWSHPAFAHRRVYARNDKELVCADLAAP